MCSGSCTHTCACTLMHSHKLYPQLACAHSRMCSHPHDYIDTHITHTYYTHLPHVYHRYTPTFTHSCTYSLPLIFIHKHKLPCSPPTLTLTYTHIHTHTHTYTTCCQTQCTFCLINLIDTYSQGEAAQLIPWRHASGHLLPDLTHSDGWHQTRASGSQRPARTC